MRNIIFALFLAFKMKSLILGWVVVFCIVLGPMHSKADCRMHFSVIPNDREFLFYCEFINCSSSIIETPGYFMANDNMIYSRMLSDPDSEFVPAGCQLDIAQLPPCINVLPNSNRVERAERGCFKYILGKEYEEFKWGMCFCRNKVLSSSCMLIGCENASKELKLPRAKEVATNSISKLAFVFDERDEQKDGISFIFANNGVVTNSVFAPCLAGSKIIFETSSHASTNSLAIFGASGDENDLAKAVPPGECIEWRYSWHSITNALPQGVCNAIKNAGHVKMRWKCGDFLSDPLCLWLKCEN